MSIPEPKFCLPRAQGARFVSMHAYRDWFKAGDFVYQPPPHVNDFMEHSGDIETFELASPANHHSINV